VLVPPRWFRRSRPVAIALACAALTLGLSVQSPAGAAGTASRASGNADFIGVWDATTGGWTILTQDGGGACTGTSDYAGYAMSDCKVTGPAYVFTLTTGSYVSHNSGTITGNDISGMFSDNNGTTEDYTATRTPRRTTAKVRCDERPSPVGSFACTATVTAADATFGSPTGSADWTEPDGRKSSESCALAHLSSTSSSCTVTYLPTQLGNETQTITANVADSGPFGASEASAVVRPVSVAATAKPVDTYLEGSDDATFKVVLSRASDDPVAVDFETKDGTGVDAAKAADGDYLRTAGSLTFSPGETEKTLTVKCFADITVRDPSDFDVVLSAPTGASFDASQSARANPTTAHAGGPATITVRGDIDPDLRVGRVGAIKNLKTGKPGTLYVQRYDTTKIFKLTEGDWVYVGDVLFLDANNASVVEFVLGGAVAVQPGSHVSIVDARHTYVQSGSKYEFLDQTIKILRNVSHQKETIQIQTNGGVIGIKG
jgi:hypothetical protein